MLSTFCRDSGCVLQSLPIQGRAMANGQYVQLLRRRAMRHATSSVALQLRQPRRPAPQCLLGGRAGAVERADEANQDDHLQRTVSFATDPCHGLYCKRRWKRVMRRHDSIRDNLARKRWNWDSSKTCGPP